MVTMLTVPRKAGTFFYRKLNINYLNIKLKYDTQTGIVCFSLAVTAYHRLFCLPRLPPLSPTFWFKTAILQVVNH